MICEKHKTFKLSSHYFGASLLARSNIEQLQNINVLVHDVMMQERDYYYGTQKFKEWKMVKLFIEYNKTVKIVSTANTHKQTFLLPRKFHMLKFIQ